ncbi:glycopeptide antibiotics resistance protein [Lederbergia galactosidilyticus]|uniref:VanZ family protein n=1 Tax=Lederbergia galactosidilytica TaxID=217031 RepID=UPI001AEA208C|nr:VanZ family protein [Lederbergia galactosidilytica]MBP1916104.1 glycopeptide antibiotics resistance protein [Lederbergia galactosidilytica]
MRLQEIIGILKENFTLALGAVIVVGICFFLGYVIVYRKLMGGKKRLSKKQLLLTSLFIGYFMMVIGVTFLNRNSHYPGGVNLAFFSSYQEAWNSFSVREWQFLYLNILMFVPFGILLPLWHARFRKARWTIGLAAVFTLSIETFQLLTGFGVFELDDLFNNLLGAIIGYGIIMGILTIKDKGIKHTLFYFSPILIVVLLSGGMFAYYYTKEFGNLVIVPNYKTNMANATITNDVQLDDERKNVPIYQAPSYTKASGEEFAVDFFKRQHHDTGDMEVTVYPDEGIYQIQGYSIWFQFLDGGYRFTDFSSLDAKPKDTDEKTLNASVTAFGIDIPVETDFQKVETGIYEWTADKIVNGNQLIDGYLNVQYYNDDTVKYMDNQMITYDKVKDVQIKSEQEAYDEILAGKFKYYPENNRLETLHINQVEVTYYLDSKGFYQPVYAFQSIIDGRDMTMYIPGMD